MWRESYRRILLLFSVLVFSSIIAYGQEEGPGGQNDAGDQPADQPADAADAENGTDEPSYQGIWSARFGPVTLEWTLREDSYEFYAYQEESVRIGSRGTLRVEDDTVIFTSEETTSDGNSWTEIDLPEKERRARFGLILNEEALRLAQPDRRQFSVEYRSRDESLMPSENRANADTPQDTNEQDGQNNQAGQNEQEEE